MSGCGPDVHWPAVPAKATPASCLTQSYPLASRSRASSGPAEMAILPFDQDVHCGRAQCS